MSTLIRRTIVGLIWARDHPLNTIPLRTLPAVQNNRRTAHWKFLPVGRTNIYNPTPCFGPRSADSVAFYAVCLVLKSFLLHNLIDCAGRRIPCNTHNTHTVERGASRDDPKKNLCVVDWIRDGQPPMGFLRSRFHPNYNTCSRNNMHRLYSTLSGID